MNDDNIANPVVPSTPTSPDVPDTNSDTPKRNTFQLFKDSWRGFSKQQKGQLIVVLALVLGLPMILGGVYTAKLYKSGAATPPISPPQTSTPYPTPITPPVTPRPTLTLSITTNSFIDGQVGQSYRNFFYGEESGFTSLPTLKFSIANAPLGLSMPTALCGTSFPTDRQVSTIRLECALDGMPKVAGNFVVKATLTDNSGRSVSKNIPITIRPASVIKRSCGSICRSAVDCPAGLTCYQPPTPTCPRGKKCPYIAPVKTCRNLSCPTSANCSCATPAPSSRPGPTVKPSPTPAPICLLKIFGLCLLK